MNTLELFGRNMRDQTGGKKPRGLEAREPVRKSLRSFRDRTGGDGGPGQGGRRAGQTGQGCHRTEDLLTNGVQRRALQALGSRMTKYHGEKWSW